MVHRLLNRQLKKLGIDPDTPPDAQGWGGLLAQIDRSYTDADQDRYLLERSLAISSREMQELYDDLKSASEARYRSIFEGVKDAIIVFSPQGEILDANLCACEMYGLCHEELVHQGIQDLVSPDQIEFTTQELFKEDLSESLFQSVNLRSGGMTFPVEVTARRQLIRGEEVILAVVRDISERTRAEEALRESEEKFRNLAEKSPNMIFINQGGKVVYVNIAGAEVMGYTREEFYDPDFNFLSLFSPEVQPEINKAFKLHLKGKEVPPYESTLITKDGRLLHALHATRLISYGGRMAILGIVTDVTAMRKAEEALTKHAAQLSILNTIGGEITVTLDIHYVLERTVQLVQESFNYEHVAIFLFDPEQETLTMRARAGVYRDQFPVHHRLKLGQGLVGWVGKHRDSILVNDVRVDRRYINLYPSLINTLSELSVPIKVGDRLLGVLDIQSRDQNAFDENDVMMMSTLVDQIAAAIENANLYQQAQHELVERKRMESQLSLQASALESTANAIVITDRDGTIHWVNPAFENLTGFAVKDVVGKNPRVLKSGVQDERFYKQLWKTILAGNVWHGELVNRRKDGTTYTEEQTITPVLNEEEEIQYFVAIKQDISERVESEERIKQQAEDLALLNAVNELINRGESFENIVKHLTFETERIFNGFGVTLYLLDEEGQHLEAQNIPLSGALAKKVAKLVRQPGPLPKLPLAPAARIKEIMKNLRPLCLSDPKEIEALVSEVAIATEVVDRSKRESVSTLVPEIIRLLNITSMILVPLVSEGDATGLLIMARDYPFSLVDEKRINAIAGQLVMAFHRTRADEALRLSEAGYRNIFEGVHDAILVVGMNGEVLDANARAYSLYKWDREALIGKMISELVPTGHLAVLPHDLEQDEIPEGSFETINLRADGKHFPVEMTARLHFIGDDRVMLVVVRDITERKQAEEELVRSEERLRILFESAPDAYFLTNMKGILVDGNRVVETLTGYKKDEFLGKSFMDKGLLAESDLPRLRETLRRNAGGESTGPDEFLVTRRDGKGIPVEVTTYPVNIEGQTLVLGIARDISERVKAEAAIREREERFRSVAETAVDAIVLVDRHDTIRYWNKAAETIFGHSTEEIVGENIRRIFAESPANHGQRAFFSQYTRGGKILSGRTLELRGARKNGETFPLELSFSSWGTGGEQYTSAIIRDVSELRQTQRRAQLQDRLAAVGQLAAGIAHDFNNLLGTIILYSELTLKNKSLLPKDRDRINTVVVQAHRGATLVSQILDFSRRSVMEMSPMDLRPFFQDLEKLLSRTLPENVEILVEFQDDADYMVNADPTRMQQVIMNLALNARDAMPKGGQLRFSLTHLELDPLNIPYSDMKAGRWIRLKVTDTGEGIHSDVMPHIFEPFFTTKDQGEGTGLGLAQVYGVVKQHEGFIDARSNLGEGTIFTIYLPSLKESMKPSHAEPGVISKEGAGQHILIVEDDEATRLAICEILLALGYQATHVADGQQALDMLEEMNGAIQLIISDLVMPNMGGRDLYDRVMEEFPETKMALMTGYPLGDGTRRLLDRRKVTWLQKPITTETLAQAVYQLLGEDPAAVLPG